MRTVRILLLAVGSLRIAGANDHRPRLDAEVETVPPMQPGGIPVMLPPPDPTMLNLSQALEKMRGVATEVRIWADDTAHLNDTRRTTHVLMDASTAVAETSVAMMSEGITAKAGHGNASKEKLRARNVSKALHAGMAMIGNISEALSLPKEKYLRAAEEMVLHQKLPTVQNKTLEAEKAAVAAEQVQEALKALMMASSTADSKRTRLALRRSSSAKIGCPGLVAICVALCVFVPLLPGAAGSVATRARSYKARHPYLALSSGDGPATQSGNAAEGAIDSDDGGL